MYFLSQGTSRITSSRQCLSAQRSQVMSRLGSQQGPCTPQGAAAGKSSLTTTWKIRTAPFLAPQLSRTAVALKRRRAQSVAFSSLMVARAGGLNRDVLTWKGAIWTAAREAAQQIAAPPKGNPKDVTCAASVASRTPHPPI